jgi:hypothetical protein
MIEEQARMLGTLAGPTSTPETEAKLSDAEMLNQSLMGLRTALFDGPPDLPRAIGIGFSPDSESFDVRALIIDAAGTTSDPIPFFTGLQIAGPVTPQSPGVLAADSELVVMLSIDFPEIYARMTALEASESSLAVGGEVQVSGEAAGSVVFFTSCLLSHSGTLAGWGSSGSAVRGAVPGWA